MTYQPQRFTAPDGTPLLIVREEDYDRLAAAAEDRLDLEDATRARAAIDAGEGTMPGAVLKLILDGDSAVAAWRKHRTMSQADLARRANLSQPFINKIEAGKTYGTRTTREKLAAALDAPVWALDEA